MTQINVAFPTATSAMYALAAVQRDLSHSRRRLARFADLRRAGMSPGEYERDCCQAEADALEAAERSLSEAIYPHAPESADPVTAAKALDELGAALARPE
jgi:hypothetical protein